MDMDLDQIPAGDLGLEFIKWPITAVRMHRTDGQWLVEYRRKPKWFFDRWWWFNDGKFPDYTQAKARADQLGATGYILSVRYRGTNYVEVNKIDEE